MVLIAAHHNVYLLTVVDHALDSRPAHHVTSHSALATRLALDILYFLRQVSSKSRRFDLTSREPVWPSGKALGW